MPVAAPAMTVVHAARPGPRPITAEDLWALPRVGAPVPSPDGAWVLLPVTRADLDKNENRTQIWLLSADARRAPRALTAAELSAGEPRWAPDGASFGFLRKGEHGRAQVWVMPLAGGEPRALTSLPLGVQDMRWLPDGRGLVVAAQLLKGHATPEATRAEMERRDKDPVKAHVTEDRFYRYWDTWLTTGEVTHLFVVDAVTGEARDLTPTAEDWFDWMEPTGQFDISPEGGEVAFAAMTFDARRSHIRARLWTVPVAGGEAVCLTPDAPDSDVRPRYSPDGAWILYGHTEDPEFYADRVRLHRYDRARGVHQPWLPDWDWSPMHWSWAGPGTVVFEAEHHARVKVFAWSGTGEPRALTRDGAVGGLAAAADGRLWFNLQTLASPAELHTCRLDDRTPARVTHFTDEVAARFATGEVREMHIEGADGVTVQMFVVLPPGADGSRPLPLVHMVHGGPHGIFGDMFFLRWNAQLFAAPGRVAALVNFQGSTSWGQEFAQCIQGEWARKPFEDVMRATDALIAAGLADPARMAATGGSYGGYMASWIAGHTDRFRCIVCHAGVNDLTAQYASDVTQGRGKAAGGEAWDGIEKQDAWSPVRFARDMITPMLVIHGERDYRVPVGQGLLLYGMLKAKGVPARLVYFPDENHWVLKPKNALLWNREVAAWLDRWLV